MQHLPNLITAVRIVLTPWIVVSLLQGDCRLALWLSIIAGSTDFLDGLAARKLGVVSRSGAYLDPIADKFLLTSLYISFGLADLVPALFVWVTVGRDVLILSLVAIGMMVSTVRDYPPTRLGKLTTMLQIVASVAFLARCAYPESIPLELQNAMLWSTALVTTLSGLQYVCMAVVGIRGLHAK